MKTLFLSLLIGLSVSPFIAHAEDTDPLTACLKDQNSAPNCKLQVETFCKYSCSKMNCENPEFKKKCDACPAEVKNPECK